MKLIPLSLTLGWLLIALGTLSPWALLPLGLSALWAFVAVTDRDDEDDD
jgi:hypothetical protein